MQLLVNSPLVMNRIDCNMNPLYLLKQGGETDQIESIWSQCTNTEIGKDIYYSSSTKDIQIL